MTYEETLHYLYNQLPVFQQVGSSAYKPGLGNSEALDVFFDHPHRKYHTIHIAGTNGKGSTSHLLAAILQQSGYKVGLYTSPHLVDFRERIRVNGEVISKEAVMDFTQRYIEPTRNIHPSFFELTMMMAFDYFAACKVDVAVIEVGLGGRLDSTNIITPDLSIITNISFDHVQFLGNTLPEIAKEKAGIIKPNIPVLIGEAEGEIRQIFIDKARCENSPIYFAEDIKPIIHSRLEDSGKWIFESNKYPNLTGELGGFCQEKNAATVLAAIELLQQMNYVIPDKAVYQGFRNVTKLTGLQGRWQRINDIPKVICDLSEPFVDLWILFVLWLVLAEFRLYILRLKVGNIHLYDNIVRLAWSESERNIIRRYINICRIDLTGLIFYSCIFLIQKVYDICISKVVGARRIKEIALQRQSLVVSNRDVLCICSGFFLLYRYSVTVSIGIV